MLGLSESRLRCSHSSAPARPYNRIAYDAHYRKSLLILCRTCQNVAIAVFLRVNRGRVHAMPSRSQSGSVGWQQGHRLRDTHGTSEQYQHEEVEPRHGSRQF
eukprot:SAG31_NODE_2046_length_6572_cov_5.058396_2_plen_102_part_00